MPGSHKWLTRYSVPSRQKKTTNDRNRKFYIPNKEEQ
nr:MAG TPA: hypothetical protein [Caudoviricetes sp.]